MNQHKARYIRKAIRPLSIIALLCAGWLVYGCKAPPPQAPLAQQSSSLIGGTPSLEHPAVGALQRDGINFCTATLIAPRVVLTAGHCIDSARIYARTGNQLRFRIDLPDNTAPDGYKSRYFVASPWLLETHPRWQPADVSRGFDVGILILQDAVPAAIATPIPYNHEPLDMATWANQPVLFLGYGLIHSNPFAVSPNRKHALTMTINQLQADSIRVQAPGQGLCHGDSGGPALAQWKGQWRVLAVNSYGDAQVVQGSNPARSRCDRGAYAFRTDLWTDYIDGWVQRFAFEAQATCQTSEGCGICGTCDTGTQQCQTKIDLSSTPLHCRACQTDADCGQGLCLQTPLGWRCAVPCDRDACCPQGTFCAARTTATGHGNVCIPHAAHCTPPPCQTDTDCGTGQTCNNALCVTTEPPRKAGVCWRCQQQQDCKTKGLWCEQLTMGGRCLQDCEMDGRCPTGFLCQQAYPGGKRRCLPQADACPLTCTADSDCTPGDTCQSGKCASPSPAQEDESCADRACATGLTCATTLTGRRCAKPCHVPPGERNGACLNDRTCAPDTRCTPIRGIKGKFCLPTCSAASECPDGGQCVGGVCVCKNNSDCKTDAICELSFGGDTGFCVASAAIRGCGEASTCTFFVDGSYCIADQARIPARRNTGQACDERTSCHAGLQCLAIRNQANLCANSCRESVDCIGGGRCVQGTCLCQSDLQCPKGRRCQLFLNGDTSKYGICAVAEGDVPCVADAECSIEELCKQGQCTPGDRPTPEVPTEPPGSERPIETDTDEVPSTKEPATPDASTTDQREVELPPETIAKESGTSEGPSPDLGPTPPDQGCRCDASPATPTALALWLLLVVCLSWAGAQRPRPQRTSKPSSSS